MDNDVTEETLHWTWGGMTIEVGVTRRGQGPEVLMLPALSSISTRHEMDALQALLAERFTTISVDWPGFGDRPRPFMEAEPSMLTAFIDHLLDEVVFLPEMIVAAGHGAGMVIRHLEEHPDAADRLTRHFRHGRIGERQQHPVGVVLVEFVVAVFVLHQRLTDFFGVAMQTIHAAHREVAGRRESRRVDNHVLGIGRGAVADPVEDERIGLGALRRTGEHQALERRGREGVLRLHHVRGGVVTPIADISARLVDVSEIVSPFADGHAAGRNEGFKGDLTD